MPRYVLEERIGAGGMAEVFRARAEGPDGFARACAVKRLLPELARDAALQTRFVDEARIAAALDHPCIVPVTDFFESAGVRHLVMELVDGTSAEALYLRGMDGRFVPVAATAALARELARALEYAHARDVLHRDVSLCNVLVSREGAVKLADFGLATARERLVISEPGSVSGKLGYLSPERRRGLAATPADDLWALGVVLGRLLEAADPRERARPDSQQILTVQARLVDELPARRLASATALLGALAGVPTASTEVLAALVRAPSRPAPKLAARPLHPDDLDDTTHPEPTTTPYAAEETTASETSAVLPPRTLMLRPPRPGATDRAWASAALAAALLLFVAYVTLS